MAYGRETIYIAVHLYKGIPYQKAFSIIEKIMVSHQGRPHFGKMHTQGAEYLSKVYPEWERVIKAYKAIDPKGLFQNSYIKKVFGL